MIGPVSLLHNWHWVLYWQQSIVDCEQQKVRLVDKLFSDWVLRLSALGDHSKAGSPTLHLLQVFFNQSLRILIVWREDVSKIRFLLDFYDAVVFPQVPQHRSFGRDLEEHLQDQADRLNISIGTKIVEGEGYQFLLIHATSWPEMQCQTTKVEELKANWRNQLFGQPRMSNSW